MIVAVCLDDGNGMLFNRRRQSRDRAQQEDLLALCAGGKLWIAPFSEKLLSWKADRIQVDENFLDRAGVGEVCFVEDRPLAGVLERIEEVIVYRWQRDYPADFHFDLDLSVFHMAEQVEFPGSSHQAILRERYVRE